MKQLIFVAYYLYLVAIIFGTAYIVFWRYESGWWFLLTAVFTQISPYSTTTKE
jgi:hypothetical protein